jgi:sporulation protein YlmC with PRC-barrel domain
MGIRRENEPSQTKVLNVPRMVSFNSLNRDRVVNVNGENLGKIEDIMVDIETGRIPFAVLSTGGFLGGNARLYAVPWDALKYSMHDKTFVLNITKETLANAPSFTKSHWPDLSSLDWLKQVYFYYGVQPYWKD